MPKKTSNTFSPFKKQATDGKSTQMTSPIMRRQEVVFCANSTIPSDHVNIKNDDGQFEGRVLGYDMRATVATVLISARKAKANDKSEDDLLLGFASLTLEESVNVTTKKKTMSSLSTPDTARSGVITPGKSTKTQNVDDGDEEWKEDSDDESATSSNDSSIPESDYYYSEDENDLDWGLKDDENIGIIPDPFSPDKAKGMIEYTVPDYETGTTRNVRRSSRLSMGSTISKWMCA